VAERETGGYRFTLPAHVAQAFKRARRILAGMPDHGVLERDRTP
jgi:hypothetical protein